MNTLNSIYAIVPSAAAAPRVGTAAAALPGGERRRLVGVHVAPLAVSYGLVTDMAVASYIEAQQDAIDEENRESERAFRKAAETVAIPCEWRSDTTISDPVSERAGALCRAADLIIYPQVQRNASIGRHAIEHAVFSSGRPVLALPEGWSGPSLGQRVLIAWDGGREAARAVFDAMPLLCQAANIRIVSVQGVNEDPVRSFTPADDIAATLSRHGLSVDTSTFASSRGSVLEELKVQLLDTGSDLCVMGCYGHSRFREIILGGVSRDILKELPFPVLFSN